MLIRGLALSAFVFGLPLGAKAMATGQYSPRLTPLNAQRVLSRPFLLEPSERYFLDELDQIGSSTTVQKLMKIYDRYIKIIDLDEAREGKYKVTIEVSL